MNRIMLFSTCEVGGCDSKQDARELSETSFLEPRVRLLVGWVGKVCMCICCMLTLLEMAGCEVKCRGMRRCRSVGLSKVLAFT
jgi:hypothetical protein